MSRGDGWRIFRKKIPKHVLRVIVPYKSTLLSHEGTPVRQKDPNHANFECVVCEADITVIKDLVEWCLAIESVIT